MRKSLLLCVLLLTASGFAENCTRINTEQFWDNSVTEGWTGMAQTFEAPSANCSILSDWEFKLAGRTSPGQITFNIYQWGDSGPVGNPVYSQTFDWGTQAQTFDATNIGLALQPGQLYGADVDFGGYSGDSAYFSFNQKGYSFDAWFYNAQFGGWNEAHGTNQYFIANFDSVPEPSTFMLFGSSLIGVGGLLRRKLFRG